MAEHEIKVRREHGQLLKLRMRAGESCEFQGALERFLVDWGGSK